MSLPNLEDYLPDIATCDRVALYGQRVAERYDDAKLAVLAKFPKLAWLEMLHHKITHVPRGLRALRHAWIGSAPALVTLDGIEDAAGLEWLELTNLPALDLADALARLARLPHLSHLSLRGDAVRELPAALARLPKLAELKLEYTPNLDLDQAFAMIAKVPTLRALTLGEIVVPPSLGKLAALPALHRLTVLAKNTLPDELGQLAALEELALPKAKCPALPATIGKLSALAVLDITAAKAMTTLPEEIGDCQALHTIHAGSSGLQKLPDSIGRLTALRDVNVAYTRLGKLPRSMGSLANLRILELPHDKKIEVPEEVFQLSLEKFTGPDEVQKRLTLRRQPTPAGGEVVLSEAARLPEDLSKVGKLQLSLPEHDAPIPQLSRLPCVGEVVIDTGNLDDAFTRLAGAPKLGRLTIQGERDTLPDSIGRLTQLTALSIDSGDTGDSDKPGTLRTLPATLGKLAGLKRLAIQRHRMTKPPEMIGELAALEWLRLNVGELGTLPRSFGHLTHLRELQLHNVRDLALPDELTRCTALTHVEVHAGWGDCKIENLAVLGRLPALRDLRLVYIREQQDWKSLFAALAGSALETLDLSHSELGGKLPAEIGTLTKLQRLELHEADIKALPPELRRCTELRRVSWSRWRLSDKGHAELKQQLPPGRWKKQKVDRVELYQRSK